MGTFLTTIGIKAAAASCPVHHQPEMPSTMG